MTSAAILRQLLDVPEGWSSAVQVGFDLAGDDRMLRSEVRQSLNDLVRAKQLRAMHCRHRDESMQLVWISHTDIALLLEPASAP